MRRLISVVMIIFSLVVLAPLSVQAATPSGIVSQSCDNAGGGGGTICDNSGESVDGFLTNIVNFLLFLVGFLSVAMIIFGGIKYTLSAGDSAKLTSAKNTILYAVIGLVVAMLAYAIVSMVSTMNWTKGPDTSGSGQPSGGESGGAPGGSSGGADRNVEDSGEANNPSGGNNQNAPEGGSNGGAKPDKPSRGWPFNLELR